MPAIIDKHQILLNKVIFDFNLDILAHTKLTGMPNTAYRSSYIATFKSSIWYTIILIFRLMRCVDRTLYFFRKRNDWIWGITALRYLFIK